MSLKSVLPIKAVQIYGENNGNVLPVKVDSSGQIIVSGMGGGGGGGSTDWFYISSDITSLTTEFHLFAFNFTARAIVIINDSDTNYIEFSFDGTNVHGKLKSHEVFMFDGISRDSIYLRGQAGGEGFRLWSW
ncbi:MAG: hypothetical protein QXL18_05245 [Candidatus Woesearchaeota archaeon]